MDSMMLRQQMSEFYLGLLNILSFGYLLLCIGWIYVCYTEYKFRKEVNDD
jgi:hypothetical protein